MNIENDSAEAQSIDLFSAVDTSGQNNRQDRFTLPYAANYPSGSSFAVLIGSETYSFTINAETTLAQLIEILNEKTFSKWSVISSNAIDGNVIDCISVNGATALTINLAETYFSIGTGFDSRVNSILIQADNKIISGGLFSAYNGSNVGKIARLLQTGSIDTSFVTGSGFNGEIKAIVQQADSKLIIAGHYSSFNGNTTNRIIRLNTDGSIDGTFNIGTGFDGGVNALVIQTDDKIVCAGEFTDYNGTPVNFICRLNSDGSIDGTFNIGTGFDDIVYSLALQADGKILAGGDFTNYNGAGVNRLARLNSNGLFDSTYYWDVIGSARVHSITVQPDNKILAGGVFTYAGGTKQGIIRTGTDGLTDAAFDIGIGFDSTVYAICLQSDSKVLIGGNFGSYNGTVSGKLIRLNSDGSIDTALPTGFNGDILSIAIQSDEKVLCGGSFTTFNGNSRNRVIRLNNDLTDDTITS